jgi:hypothetical protein
MKMKNEQAVYISQKEDEDEDLGGFFVFFFPVGQCGVGRILGIFQNPNP